MDSDADADAVMAPRKAKRKASSALDDSGAPSSGSADAASNEPQHRLPGLFSPNSLTPEETADGSGAGCKSPFLNRSCLEAEEDFSDGLPFQLVQDKGKGIKGPSPLPQYLPEQPSKLDHTKPGNWVWWKVDDATWMLAQVQGSCITASVLSISACLVD